MNANILEEKYWDKDKNPLNETLFSQANGYLGIRGSFEEGFHDTRIPSVRGTYINGFYEKEKILYGESAYGFAKINEIMLNIPDGTKLEFDFEGDIFTIDTGSVLSYRRWQDMSEGILRREIHWKSPTGKEVHFLFERVVALFDPHLLGIRVQILPLNFSATMRLTSMIDANVKNLQNKDDPRIGSQSQGYSLDILKYDQNADEASGGMLLKTIHSGLYLSCFMQHSITPSEYTVLDTVGKAADFTNRTLRMVFEIPLKQNQVTVFTKKVVYRACENGAEEKTPLTCREPRCEHLAYKTDAQQEIIMIDFDELVRKQKETLNDYWKVASIQMPNQPETEKALRFNQFHLYQSVGKDGIRNISSKGLSGEGYGGHYFWDTEIYVFPFFLFRIPEIARKLLEYRYHILPYARKRARDLGHGKGALYPWRTIAGEECSAYYPAGTAQYHINADIAYAIQLYFEVTRDTTFMVEKGAEILFETARIWEGLGHFNPYKNDNFTIDCVTGPDEYTAVVNNNYYTNTMAKNHLTFAVSIYRMLKETYSVQYEKLKNAIDLQEEEVIQWERMAQKMYMPSDEKHAITPQDDSFLSKKNWDFQNTPRDQYPLLLHFHPLVIYRHQVCKQADVLLAHVLRGESVTMQQKKRDFDYYEPITTHDSSLSPSIHSIIASEIGYSEKALRFFEHTTFLDIQNLHGNSSDGLHLAALAGSWLALVYGFAGLRILDGELSFRPTLPNGWDSYRFLLTYRGTLLSVLVETKRATYRCMEGPSISLLHYGERLDLHPGQNGVGRIS